MTFLNRLNAATVPQLRYRIGFLFHEAAHQVAHSAPIASQLALTDPQADVIVLGTSDALMQRAWDCCAPEARLRIRFEKLPTPNWHRFIARGLDAAMPFSRVANLIEHRKLLAGFDALVVPERTSLFLKTLLGHRAPALIHTKHGSGDRSQGYSPVVGKFDLVLVSGAKVRDRLVNEVHVPASKCAVIGYAKFDTVHGVPPARLFANNNPTVIYNPHPHPRLSSWFDMGLEVLQYFSQHTDYNLIFAPHVMLFQRKFHVSVEHAKVRLRRNIPRSFFDCKNILIDTGSEKLLDMTYIRAADVYLGDVSSQIYEFLLTPRPVVFLNPAQKEWRGDVNYSHWHYGPVVHDVAGLASALRDCVARPARYRQAQERGFRYTFDLNDTPSSLRAARAVAQFARQSLFARERHAIDAAGGRVDAVQQF
jgi:hypothetical protein